MPDRYPEVIVTPSDADGVAEAVRAAGREGRRVAVRSGGHNWLGSALRDGSMLIDVGLLKQVTMRPDLSQVEVGAGATHKILADHLVDDGFAFPIGHCPSVGLGGYLLSGGMGWNLRSWGPACWNIAAAHIVTAEGQLTRIDDSNSADLMWALKGGGPGFPGVVTSFVLDLFPLPHIASRSLTFRLQELPHLLSAVAEGLEATSPGLEVSLIVRPARPGMRLDAQVTVAATAFSRNQPEAEYRLDECTAWTRTVAIPNSDSGPRPMRLNDLEGEGGWSDQFRYAADTRWVSDRLTDLGGMIVDNVLKSPSTESRVVLAFAHLPKRKNDTAFSAMGVLTANVYATWQNASSDGENIGWLRAFVTGLNDLSSGMYIGEADTLNSALSDAYPSEKLKRLTTVAREHDPDSVFHGFLT